MDGLVSTGKQRFPTQYYTNIVNQKNFEALLFTFFIELWINENEHRHHPFAIHRV